MNPLYKLAIAGFIALAMYASGFTSGWVVHGWKVGADQTKQVQAQMTIISGQLTQFSSDQKATLTESRAVSDKLNGYAGQFMEIQREIGDEKSLLTKPVAADCSNPFTLDFVRVLNGIVTHTGSPSATTGSGPGQVSGP